MRRMLLAAGVGAIALLLASAAGTTTATIVKVTLAQPSCMHYTVTAQPAVAKAGQVTFVVSNKGNLGHNTCPGEVGISNIPQTHELVVLKTNLPPGKLPLTARASVTGFQAAVEVGRVGTRLIVKPGQTRTLTLTLKPGKYVFICNLLDHYTSYHQNSAFVVSG